MKIRLQGHEKFALRDGWITKGLNMLSETEACTVFSSENAPDKFGIGSNMVKSLRFWMKAFGLTEDVKGGVCLSDLGSIIKKHDLYIEDVFTLWILHSNIIKNNETATSWYIFFNKFDALEFEKEDAFQVMKHELSKINVDEKSISDRSLNADVDVLLGMYSKSKEVVDPEDKSSSPFAQLGLIKHVDSKKYLRTNPDKRLINEYLVLYELEERFEKADSLSIATLMEGENSLAAIYHISSIDVNRYLDKLQDEEYILINRTAGLDVIYKVKDISKIEVLEKYYKQKT